MTSKPADKADPALKETDAPRTSAQVVIGESPEGFLDRSRAAVRQLWKGWTRNAKTRIARLDPDLPTDELAVVRRHVDACLSGRGGQVTARARAAELGRAYLDLSDVGKQRFFALLASHYGPDLQAIRGTAAGFIEACDEDGDVRAVHARLQAAMRSPRLELLKQFNSLEQGIKFLVDLRSDLIDVRAATESTDPELIAFDRELRDLLASWFDVGFLTLSRITWDAPASLLEKLVRYEAVHAIRGTEDMRNRLQSDRRCYAFFHPNMPNEPLIFVEVALTDGIASNVHDLLNQQRETKDPGQADTAIFYSISNAQAGLAGVGFGDFLIKRVVNELTHELPRLKTFATLSPIPGFRSWLFSRFDENVDVLTAAEHTAINKVSDSAPPEVLEWFFDKRAEKVDPALAAAVKPVLMRLCAAYLTSVRKDRGGRLRAVDSVAHFHLTNGARVERLNWRADLSRRGLSQSAGLMVNYLYKLPDIERNHEAYRDKGDIRMSHAIKSLT